MTDLNIPAEPIQGSYPKVYIDQDNVITVLLANGENQPLEEYDNDLYWVVQELLAMKLTKQQLDIAFALSKFEGDE